MKLGLFILLAAAGQASGQTYTSSATVVDAERWTIEEIHELGLKPTGQDVLTKIKMVRALVRAAKPAGSNDEAALKTLATAYNENLVPALHHLRNTLHQTLAGFDSLSLAGLTVDINARLGKQSQPVSRNDPSLKNPGNFGPARPADRKLMDDLRIEALSYGVQSRLGIEKTGRLVGSLDPVTVSTPVAAAVKAMGEAVSSSSSAANGWIRFLEDGGMYVQALEAYQHYLEAANAAKAPVPELRKAAVQVHNAATKEIAGLEFQVGDDIMVGRSIEHWLDDLGPL